VRGRVIERLGAAAREVDRSIAVLALMAFISQVGVSMMLPLLPVYAIELGATPTQLGFMVAAFSVTSTIGQLSSGWLASWIPARRQMPLGQAVYATGNFLIASTAAAVPLIAFRAMSGLGGGLTIIAERLYIARAATRARLAFLNGVVSAAGSSGSILGPVLGAVLALQDLRIPFVVVGCTATVAAVAALLFLPPERGEPADSASAALADPAAESVGEPEAGGWWARSKPLVVLGLWSLGFNASYGGWITTFAPYSIEVLGLTPSHVALFFGAFGLGSIVLGPYLARIADRSGRRRMVALGSGLVLLNVAAMVVPAPVPLIYASAVIAGGGLSAATASWFALLGVATDGGRRGRSFGTVSALSNLGVIGGAAVASTAWELVGVREGLVSAGLFLALAAASLLLVPADRPAESAE
jgi:MFS family permease